MKKMKKNMTNKKRFGKLGKLLALGLSLALTVTTVTGCGENSGAKESEGGSAGNTEASASGDLTPLRLGVMTGNIDHLIELVGQEQGIFAKNGIDLQVTEYAAGINSVDALTMDQLDVAIAADFAILNRIGNTEGSDLKIIANYGNVAGGQLYANPETVKDANDLKGKKLINLPGVIYEYWNVLTAEKAGLKEGEYELVNVDSQPSAVAVASQGDGDAFWGSGEVAAQLEANGWKPIMTLDDIGAITTLFFIAREGWAKENAETLKKFYAGFEETVDYIKNNIDDAAKTVTAKAGLDAEKFKQTIAAYDLGIQFKKKTLDYLDGVNKWLKDSQYYKNPFETQGILLLDAAKEAYPDRFEV